MFSLPVAQAAIMSAEKKSPAGPSSLFDRLCKGGGDVGLPAYYHVPLQQYAFSGVETDRVLTDAEQELWRRGLLLGYVLKKRSDQFFVEGQPPVLVSPAIIEWLGETVREKNDLPVSRLMALMHKHLAPYDRLYDLKKERSVKRFYRDLVLTVNMMLGLPPALLPQAAFDGLAEDASGLPQPEKPGYPLSKGLAYVWRYLLNKVPFEPANTVHRADFLLQFFRLFGAAHIDQRLIPPRLIDYLNKVHYPAAVSGAGLTGLMLEVFRLAGVEEDARMQDPAYAQALGQQFFGDVYRTLVLPEQIGSPHDALSRAFGIEPQRTKLRPVLKGNYVWEKPQPLTVDATRASVNIFPCDDAGGQFEPLAQRLASMAKNGMVRSIYMPPQNRLARARRENPQSADEHPWAPINLFACPVDRLADFIMHRGLYNFEGRYNIGYCSWATDRLPQALQVGLPLLDEIWVPTETQAKIFASATDRPVHVVPVPVNQVAPSPYMTRAMLDLPNDAFLFATSFDCFDWMSRKNPMAVIKAFQQAFAGDEKVALVIKTRNLAKSVALREEGHLNRMRKCWEDDPRIHVFHDDFTDAEMSAFLSFADCYASLPRATSLDTALIEAMLRGRPVIAPAATHAYLNKDAAFLVESVPCSVVFDAYHYLDREIGHKWVDPEIDSAVAAMRDVYENRSGAAQRGAAGQKLAESLCGAEAAGARMKARIEAILRQLGHGA